MAVKNVQVNFLAEPITKKLIHRAAALADRSASDWMRLKLLEAARIELGMVKPDKS